MQWTIPLKVKIEYQDDVFDAHAEFATELRALQDEHRSRLDDAQRRLTFSCARSVILGLLDVRAAQLAE